MGQHAFRSTPRTITIMSPRIAITPAQITEHWSTLGWIGGGEPEDSRFPRLSPQALPRGIGIEDYTSLAACFLSNP